jgi:phosphoribosyl 1,2-cyclic phosphate phosphodiesterase
MKIQYLGTAAAEGIPAMFCTCELCRKTARAGSAEARCRSSVLIQ